MRVAVTPQHTNGDHAKECFFLVGWYQKHVNSRLQNPEAEGVLGCSKGLKNSGPSGPQRFDYRAVNVGLLGDPQET